MTEQLTRRQRQHEATITEIVETARALVADGKELSLRAVATEMGMTAPALYRYVGSYQELVDLVAYEIDKTATDGFRAAASAYPDDDPLAQLIAASVAFRRWALTSLPEFTMVFANPVAQSQCHRREVITAWTSGIYMHSLLFDLYEQRPFPHPELDDLHPTVVESLHDPLFPVDVERIHDDHRGLLWVFMQAWATLYGTVALEAFGHMDPRVIESGMLFASQLGEWIPRLGVTDPADVERYRDVLLTELAR